MKTGLLVALIVCLASPVFADTCGPAGCDAAKAQAGQTPPTPSILQSNWKKAALPADPSKPQAPKPPEQPPQARPAPAKLEPAKPEAAKTQGPPTPPRTLDAGFTEQELMPDFMGMTQKVLPEIPTQVRLSNSDINRVICPMDIKDAIYSEEKGLTVNLSGKDGFIKFLVMKKDGREMYSTTPSELYVVCGGGVYTMVAVPARIPAQTIHLAPGKAETVKKNLELYGELPFEKKIIAIIKKIYLNDAPDSFTRTAVNRKLDVFRDLEVALRTIYAIEGEGLRIKEFEVRIPPASPAESISYKENDFLRTDISLHPVAVSAETMTLKKGETSRVFVVERTEGE